MGSIRIHMNPADIALIEKAQRGAPLTEEEDDQLRLIGAFLDLNAQAGDRPDRQNSRDGYGPRDQAKL